MSAFFVGPDHVNAILAYVESLKPYSIPMPNGSHANGESGFDIDDDLATIGRELLRENVKSLVARYPNEDWTDEIAEALGYQYRPDFTWTSQRNVALATIKLIHCFEYQSCEHDTWESSYAHDFSRWVIDRAIYNVNGYDDSPWCYRKPRKQAA